MSDRYGSNPDDEPVIGATYAPVLDDEAEAGAYDEYDDDEWEDEYEDEYSDDYDYYDDGTPARQPMFYVFIGLAVLLGGLFVYLLFALFNNEEPEIPASPTAEAGFQVIVDQPHPNDRMETGRDHDVLVRATSSEAITKFELFRERTAIDQVAAQAPSADQVYSARLKVNFSQKGDYKLFVRVTSQSGATRDSATFTVVAIEPVGEKPTAIRGQVVALSTLRTGPGEQYQAVGQLQPNTEVRIIGKNRDATWLLVEIEEGRWVKRDAIQELDSLALVQVREPTPTVVPATNTPLPQPSPSPTPSVSPSATANPNAPDFAPTNATLIDGGSKLRVTVANLSTNSFEGSLVVSVGGVATNTLTQAFGVRITANSATTIDFELNPPLTQQRAAQVRVDPDNAIRETNEDNNSATFGLTPPVEQPSIVITSVDVSGTSVIVSIRNSGGPLAAADVTVKVTIDQASAEQTKNIALSKDNPPVTFNVPKPGPGTGKVEVLIKGVAVASAPLTIP